MNQEELPFEVYAKHGIRFVYPDDWELEELVTEENVNILLESPLTVTMTISLIPSRPEPMSVIEQIMDVFETEYEEIDIYDFQEQRIGEFSVVSQEAEFVCHELINLVKCLSLKAGQFTLLVMSQGFDQDMQEFSVTLDKIFNSLSLENDDDKIIV